MLICLMILIIFIALWQYLNASEHFPDDLYDKMDIYIINLKSRPEKKEFMKKQMDKHKLNAIFFEAVDGNELDLNELIDENIISQIDDVRIKRPLRRGEIGCSMSHMLVWLRLLKSDKQYALVFEDDAILCNDFKEMLRGVIDEANTVEWDVLYLNENCYYHFKEKCDGKHVSRRIIAPTNVGYGLYGYVIKKDAVHKYIKGMLPITIPVDNFIIEKQKDKQNRVLRLEYPMVDVNRRFESDTQQIK